MSTHDTLCLAGAPIVLPRHSHETVCFAAAELARGLQLLTGKPSPLRATRPPRGAAIVLDPRGPAVLGDQGYRLTAFRAGARSGVTVSGHAPAGVLYGVYGLLEELGMGFYAGGETLPELPAPATIAATLDLTARPAFRLRGNMLHYNFLCGCTTWGLEDYQFYFDQLARMRANLLLIHWYDGEPGAAGEHEGEYLTGGVTPNSLTRPWGAMASLRTSQFSFGTGRLFDEEIFSAPPGEDLPDLLTEVKRTEHMFRQATRYARTAAIHVAAGFEAPRIDPTDAEAVKRFQARVAQFVRRNPDITHFALWQHESGGCVGSEPPAAGTPAAALLAERRGTFAYLGNDQRVWEAIRFGRLAECALEVLRHARPRLPLVLVGWGGDRWMQFADYCLGYDQLLPAGVIFTCHDNIDASMGPNVSTPWGQLPPERERWAIPWVEGDIDDCQVRQPHVESLGTLAPDALAKGCQGLLTLQWRTRDVEEETGYIARFAWNTGLTPDAFYRDLARHAFGADQTERMGRHLGTLQRLGAHWTGVRGTVECGKMQWAGWVPHFPFEVDGKTADYLVPKVEETIAALAEVPKTRDAEAAFHLIQDTAGDGAAVRDRSRPGVAVLERVLARLKALRGVTDETRLRAELFALEQEVYAVRPQLVAFGMAGRAYRALDGFLIAIHQLWRNAGARAHFRTLERIRADLARLRTEYAAAGRTPRLERLDYLAATMDFAMHYDRAVMLLADGERIDQAVAAAEQAKTAGDALGAARLAAAAYAELVPAGMQPAVAALAAKLTTRCDFGTLCTFNVKQLPLYWDTLGRLETHLPAVPPRELHARGQPGEVWLSWNPGPRTAAQHLYRRLAGSRAAWKRVNRRPLQAGTRMFVDRPQAAGRYEYAVTALAADGWESPRSHTAAATVGVAGVAPRIVACKPAGRAPAGQALPVRVVVQSDLEVAWVELVFRPAGARTWDRVPLPRRFRDSFAGEIPAALVRAPLVEFCVEAADTAGNAAVWPESAPRLPWSVSVVPA